jgi:hypothetical protein
VYVSVGIINEICFIIIYMYILLIEIDVINVAHFMNIYMCMCR